MDVDCRPRQKMYCVAWLRFLMGLIIFCGGMLTACSQQERLQAMSRG